MLSSEVTEANNDERQIYKTAADFACNSIPDKLGERTISLADAYKIKSIRKVA